MVAKRRRTHRSTISLVRGAGLGLLLTALSAGGCSRHPPSPKPPRLDAQAAAREALRLYDQNGDGRLDAAELAAVPALKMALPRLDKNGDGAVAADEIAARVTHFQTTRTKIEHGGVEVRLDGSPLAGATVTFEPEPFLGTAIPPISCVTDESGIGVLSGHDPNFPGIYLGFYRVRVSRVVDGSETVPARYNAQSELGYEVTDDIEYRSNVMVFDLQGQS